VLAVIDEPEVTNDVVEAVICTDGCEGGEL